MTNNVKASVYGRKSQDFITDNHSLAKTPAPKTPPVKNEVAYRWAIIRFVISLLTAITKIFQSRASQPNLLEFVKQDKREVSDNLEVCKEIKPELCSLIMGLKAPAPTVPWTDSIDYFSSVLAKNVHHFSSIGIDTTKVLQKIAFSHAITQDLSKVFEQKKLEQLAENADSIKKLHTIAKNIAAAVQELSVGETIILPLGPDHILCEIGLSPDKSYTFSLYNIKDSGTYHPKILQGLKYKFQGHLQIPGVKKEKITCVNFYKSLLETAFLCEENSAGRSYELILDFLEKKPVEASASRLHYRSSALSQTHSWKVLMEVLRHSCSTYEQYRRAKYLFQCQALVDVIHGLKKQDISLLSLEDLQQQKAFILSSVEELGKSITKSFDKGWLSPSELKKGRELLDSLQNYQQQTTFTPEIIHDSSSRKDTSLHDSSSWEKPVQSVKTNYPLATGLPDVEPLNLQDDDLLEKQLDRLEKIEYKDRYSFRDNLACSLHDLDILAEGIRKYPVPLRGQTDIWDQIPQDKIDRKATLIYRMIRYMTTTHYRPASYTPAILLSLNHLLAILDKLSKRSHNCSLPKVPLYAGLTSVFQGVGFILPTAAMHSYRASLEEYFDQSDLSPEKRLFSFTTSSSNQQKKTYIPFNLSGYYWNLARYPDKKSRVDTYIDDVYLSQMLYNPTVIQKLPSEATSDAAKKRALLEDPLEYLPLLDGQLMDATARILRAQCSITPTNPRFTSYQPKYPGKYYNYNNPYRASVRDMASAEYITTIAQAPASYTQIPSKFSNYEQSNSFSDSASLWKNEATSVRASFMAQSLSSVIARKDPSAIEHELQAANAIALDNQEKHEKLSFEEKLHIRLMGIDKQDAPWRLLSFLEEHVDALQEEGVQNLLTAYLYHPSITKILQEQPLFVEKIRNCFLRYYDRYIQEGRISISAFIVTHLKQLEGRYKELTHNTQPFDHINYKEKLLALEGKAKTLEDKLAILISHGRLHHQGSWLREPCTKEIAKDIVRATFALQYRQESKEQSNNARLCQEELHHLHAVYYKEMQNYFDTMETSERNLFINDLLGLSKTPQEWQGNYPNYHSAATYIDGSPTPIYAYNAMHGEYTDHGIQQTATILVIDEKILTEHAFAKDALQEHDGYFYSVDRQRRIRNHNNSIQCEYFIENAWCSYHPLPMDLLKTCQTWGLLTAKGYYSPPSGNIRIIANQKKEPIARVEIDVDNHPISVSKPANPQTPEEHQSVYHLVNANEASKDAGIQTLLPTGLATLWQGVADNNHMIEVGDNLLRFKKQNDHYISMSHPNYELMQSDPELFSGMPYIYLSHSVTKQEKAIIIIDNKLYEFDINENKEPIIKTSSDALLISLLHLMGRKYQQAGKYLQLGEHLGTLSSEGKFMISNILQCPDVHPDAIKCKMLAQSFLKKDDLLYTKPKAHDLQEVLDKLSESLTLFYATGIRDPLMGATQDLFSYLQNPPFLFPSIELYTQYLASYDKGSLSPIPSHLEKLFWKNLPEEFLAAIDIVYPLFTKRRNQLQKIQDEDQPQPLPLSRPTTPAKAFWIYLPSRRDDFLPSSHYSFLSSEEAAKRKASWILDKNLLPIIGSQDSFKAHFLDFYKEAKAGGSTELRERLRLMRQDTSSENQKLAWVLEQVLANGNKYPPVPTLSQNDDCLNELKSFLDKVQQKLPRSWSILDSLSQAVQFIKVVVYKFFQRIAKISPFLTAGCSYIAAGLTLPFRGLKKVVTWIQGPPLYKLIQELRKERSGLSQLWTRQVQVLDNEKPLPLTLQQKELFTATITMVTSELQQQLEQIQQTATQTLQKLEQEALTLAHRLPNDDVIAEVIRMNRLSGKEATLSMNDLIGLFTVGLKSSYLQQTYLNQQDIALLEQKIGEYLQQRVLQEHAKQALALYEQHTKAPRDEKTPLAEKLLQMVNEKPAYAHNNSREFLAFEGLTGLRLYPNQIRKLNLLSSQDRTSTIIHMIMGEGKSAVITPVIAFLRARQGFLPFIIVPSSLYPTGKEMTKETVFQSFGKLAHAFEFERDADFSQDKLELIAHSLQQWKKEKGFVYTTRENILSFFLKAQELFHDYEQASSAEEKAKLEVSIELAWGILKELKHGGAALLDEAHDILNCRDELNFTFGDSIQLRQDVASSIYDLMKELISHPELNATIDLLHNNQAKMSQETYLSKVKPILVDYIARKYSIDPAYLNDSLPSIPESIQRHPKKDLIAISKACITTFIPQTLTKKRDEHYGIGSKKPFCIPFKGNNTPSESSEFASYIETLLYTGYHFVQQGLSLEQLRALKETYENKCRQEVMVAKVDAKHTEANAIFTKITGQNLIEEFNEDAARRYTCSHTEAVITYCLHEIVPTITTFPRKLSANPHHLPSLFKQVDGMTGTPWNKHSYPSQFTTVEEEHIDKTSEDILKKITSDHIQLIEQSSDQEILRQIIANATSSPECRALIDAGALLKGVSNEQIATLLLEASAQNTIDGIVYYNQNNELMILERATQRSIAFKQSKIPKERRMTFYDQRHTVGSDITQGSTANALVTISETTKSFELFQAIWRMRQIHKQQTITLALPKKIQSHITSHNSITASDILAFVRKNQQVQELKDNFRSRKLEIKAIVQDAIFTALMEAPHFKARNAIFEKTKELLMQKLDISPFDAFGGIEKEEDTQKLLREYTHKWLAVLDRLVEAKVIKSGKPYAEKINNLKKIPLLPTYKTQNSPTIDTQVENQTEVQMQLEIFAQNDLRTKTLQPWPIWDWPKHLNIFKDNWMKEPSWWKSTPMPLYEANHVLGDASNKAVSSMQGVFDPNLLISNNFFPRKHKKWFAAKAEPFAWYTRPVYHLVVTEEKDGSLKTLMIDQHDLPFFREKLQQDNGNEPRKICIYDPSLGIVLQGKHSFDEAALEKNPAFSKLLIQAKFWNGTSQYKPTEIAYLSSWIKKHNPHKMLSLFKEIVRNKDASAQVFTSSALAKVFDNAFQEERVGQLTAPTKAPTGFFGLLSRFLSFLRSLFSGKHVSIASP